MGGCDDDLTALLTLRVPFLLAALEDQTAAAMVVLLNHGKHVATSRRAMLRGLSTAETRARPASPGTVAPRGSTLAAAAKAKAIAAAMAGPFPRADDTTTPRRGQQKKSESRVPIDLLNTTQLAQFLTIKSWREYADADWSHRRAAASRLVALQRMEAYDAKVLNESGILAAKLELGIAYFMLGAFDLATEVAEELLSRCREVASLSRTNVALALPTILEVRCRLFRAACFTTNKAVDRAVVLRTTAAAEVLVDQCRGDSCTLDEREATHTAARFVNSLVDPPSLPQDATPSETPVPLVAAVSRVVAASLRVAAASAELDGPPAEHMRARVAARLQKVSSQREMTALNDDLDADAQALRQRAMHLTLLVNEEANVVERAASDAVRAYKEHAAVSDPGGIAMCCSRLLGAVFVLAGRCQWAAERYRLAERWFTLAAALWDSPGRMHILCRWSLSLIKAKVLPAAWSLPCDYGSAEIDVTWADEAPPEHAPSSDSGSDTRTPRASQPPTAQDDARAHYTALLQIWPHRDAALEPYLKYALSVILKTPEAMKDVKMAARYAAAAMALNGRESKEAERALQHFEAQANKVKPPRASPSWGVHPILTTVTLFCEDPQATILYSFTGFPAAAADADGLGSSTYVTPIVLDKLGRVTLRMVSVAPDGRRSGVVELHYFVVLPC